MDVSNELMSLHIGDKILEVNGTPVRNASLQNIDQMIQSSDRVLQLTIEHDPHAGHHPHLYRQPLPSPCPFGALSACSEPTSPLQPIDTNAAGQCSPRSLQNGPEPDAPPPLLSDANGGGDAERERLFRRNEDAAYVSGTKTRQLRKTRNLNCAVSTNSLREKERCSSMSKLLDENHAPHPELYDLARTKSFRVEPQPQRIFRANDLVQGELLGKGFFGQVFKVSVCVQGNTTNVSGPSGSHTNGICLNINKCSFRCCSLHAFDRLRTK